MNGCIQEKAENIQAAMTAFCFDKSMVLNTRSLRVRASFPYENVREFWDATSRNALINFYTLHVLIDEIDSNCFEQASDKFNDPS